ncbi:MAG TPA: hypothetical protein VFJ72_10805 [Rubrobacteraceae bacterium]|nr:hypothetical protein [Rubrobacteraceae bacterium]
MLETRIEERPPSTARPGFGRSLTPGVREFLLDVLVSARSYDAPIQEAEQDGDVELTNFLRELQRQDLARTGEITRLLRR